MRLGAPIFAKADSPESWAAAVSAAGYRAAFCPVPPETDDVTVNAYAEAARKADIVIAKLGAHIQSCHAKDIILRESLTVHLNEVRPGQGNLDYPAYLRGLTRLDSDVPLMLEHLPDEDEYRAAASHIRAVAAEEGIAL